MTEEREIAIPYADLTKLSFICKQCHGEITANFADSRQIRLHSEGERYLCPLCRMEFDDRIGVALARFSEWYRLIKESRHSAIFRIVEPDD